MAWFLLGPGSSARVPSLKSGKVSAGEGRGSVQSKCARTIEATWMFPADNCSTSYRSWPRVGG